MRPPAVRLPPAAITGIGSLPFLDPVEAVAFVAAHSPQIPFWPQLPQRDQRETSIAQVCAPFAALLQLRAAGWGYTIPAAQLIPFLQRVRHASVALPASHAAGWHTFQQACAAGRFAAAVALKGQVVGPLTLAWSLWYEEQPLCCSDTALRALQAYLIRHVQWQIAQLRRWGLPVLVLLDEPCLALIAPHTPHGDRQIAVLRATVAALRQPHVLIGIHTCANLGDPNLLDVLFAAQPDLISFDADQGVELFGQHPQTVPFLQAGGYVAYGLIPTWRDLHALDLNHLLLRWLITIPEPLQPTALARQALFTATCGLGLLDPPAARESFQATQHFRQLIISLLEQGSTAVHSADVADGS